MHSNCNTSCNNAACCSFLSNEEIVNVLNNIDNEIITYSKSRINNYLYGYPYNSNKDNLIQQLHTYKVILDRYRISIFYNEKPCLCSCKLHGIFEKIKKITGKDCTKKCRTDVMVGENTGWMLNNPQCVARANWEKFAYKLCFELSMDVELMSIEDLCDIAYDLSTKEMSCDVVAAFSVYNHICTITNDIDIFSKNCNFTFDVNKTKKECEVKWQELVTKQNCDLTFKKYMELLDCKLNHSIIAEVYGNKLRLDVIDNKPHLITKSNSYNICDLKFKEMITEECETLNFKPEITNYLNSYNL